MGHHRVDRPFATAQAVGAVVLQIHGKGQPGAVPGNLVRPPAGAARGAGHRPEAARTARADGRADLERLAQRLQAALELDADQAAIWPDALTGLLQQSVHGIWTAEARLLYDLQKVCVDHERGVFKLDWLRWLFSGCRKRLKRPLPSQREVLMAKHLHAAERRVKSARLSRDNREQLSSLLETAVRRPSSGCAVTCGRGWPAPWTKWACGRTIFRNASPGTKSSKNCWTRSSIAAFWRWGTCAMPSAATT